MLVGGVEVVDELSSDDNIYRSTLDGLVRDVGGSRDEARTRLAEKLERIADELRGKR